MHIRSSVTLQRNQLIFAVEMPANIITSHSKFQLNHAKCFQDINLPEFLHFFSCRLSIFLFCFSSFHQTTKIVIKCKLVIQLLYPEI